jgi:hypothetical protein
MHHSEVMSNLAYLTDMIGPRLTGSEAVRQANEWTLARFRDYGLAAHLEPWTFGGTWTRGPSFVWNSDGPAMGAADSARREQFLRTYYTPFQGPTRRHGPGSSSSPTTFPTCCAAPARSGSSWMPGRSRGS